MQFQDGVLLIYSNPKLSQDTREHFDTRMGYILAVLGFSVGYGSFWRFPYLIYKHGGGIFLIPYTMLMITIGIPILYLETAVGQMHQNTLPKIYENINKGFKMLGYIGTLISFNICLYYNILLVYAYRYLFTGFNNPLPFGFEDTKDSYFNEHILNKSTDINQFGNIQWDLAILYLFSLWTCYQFIKRGVNMGTKILWFTVISPYVLLSILTFRGLSLPGSINGLIYLFKADFSKLFTGAIWADSAVQVFYQLSLASAGIINFASLKKKKQQFENIIYIMPISLLVCGMLSGITIFLYIGHYSHQLNVSIDDLPLDGPDLTFNVLPKAISLLPWPNLWLIVFCIMLILLGIDSEFGSIEAVTGALQIQVKENNNKVFGKQFTRKDIQFWTVIGIGLSFPFFCSSAGIYYLSFFDSFVSDIPMPFTALMQIYLFVYLFQLDKLESEIYKFTGKKIPRFIRSLLQSRFLLISLFVILGIGLYNQIASIQFYSTGKYIFGWLITLYPLVLGFGFLALNRSSEYNLQFAK